MQKDESLDNSLHALSLINSSIYENNFIELDVNFKEDNQILI